MSQTVWRHNDQKKRFCCTEYTVHPSEKTILIKSISISEISTFIQVNKLSTLNENQ